MSSNSSSESTVGVMDIWSQTSKEFIDNALEFNEAVLNTLVSESNNTAEECGESSQVVTANCTADTHDDLEVGTRTSVQKQLTDTDVQAFAASSGDVNPLHLDESYAEDTQFNGRIVHGTLVSGVISAALAQLPGVVIYLSQDLEFLAPVEIGEIVTATCEIIEDLGNNQYRLQTTVTKQEPNEGDSGGEENTTVIDGEAVVLINKK